MQLFIIQYDKTKTEFYLFLYFGHAQQKSVSV